MTWRARQGKHYFIQVGGYRNQTGVIPFTVRKVGRAVNNDYATAKEIGSLPVSIGAGNRNATHRQGEPKSACTDTFGLDQTRWYSFTALSVNDLQAEAHGDLGTFPYIAVYTGNSLATLSEVDCIQSDVNPVVFTPTTGTTYYFQVGGFAGSSWSDDVRALVGALTVGDRGQREWRGFAPAVIDWLLDADPSIRWQVMRDLTERLRRSSRPSGRASRRKDGARGCSINSAPTASGAMASPRRSGGRTCTRCCSCATWGSTRRARARERAIDLVRDNVTWGPGFGDSPFFEGEVEPCINGRVVALGAYFGERSDRLVDRLLGEQLADGGWNCEAERGSVRSSFHTTICVLEGLLAFETAFGASSTVTDARRRAQEYLLERRLLRRLSTGEIIEPTWTQFAFPPLWHYDVLRALDYLRAAGVKPDARVEEAVAIVLERREASGRWLLDVRHRDTLHEELAGDVGEPNRWITLRALRVLDWYEQGA